MLHRFLALVGLVILLGAASCAEPLPEGERVARAPSGLVTDCDFLNPTLHTPPAVPIDWNRELMIRDLSVVEDPCRTGWAAGGCPPGSVGAWTAGHLFNQMSGAPVPLPAMPAPMPPPPPGGGVSRLLGELFHAWATRSSSR